MKNKWICISILILTLVFSFGAVKQEDNDIVTVDFTMAERCLTWLEFINTGANNMAIREYFMKNVAPTKGCQSIIHHWERFKKWDEDEFYKFIMTALDKMPHEEEIHSKDGSLTMFGRRRLLWKNALYDPEQLRDDLEMLKEINLKDDAFSLAKKHLPEKTIIENDFYIVLFGHSSAFSVGKENGFDLLQLPKNEKGDIHADEVIRIFAHEMHHTGFDYWIRKNLATVKNQDKLLLIGILAAEGMPTYFIDQPYNHLQEYKSKEDSIYQEVASDWERYTARLNNLYREAEEHIRLNLEGKLGQKEIMEIWMSGAKGAAYVLGADMLSIIDHYLGHDKAVQVAIDYRQFLKIYNQAAKKAHEQGRSCFIFNQELAERISRYTGTS
jgi:hypothetical protein